MPLSDYTSLIDFLRPRQSYGCVVEIGALIGCGTRQLAEVWPYKIIWAVDIFDIHHDPTKNQEGVSMSSFYESELAGYGQMEKFVMNTRDLYNVKVFRGDSRDFPKPGEYVFLTIIDGEHTPEAVRRDFEKFKDSKFIAFHDYRHDLPEITKAIDEITEGLERHVLPGWCIVTN
jgi:hypothetical protein